jgi:predicted lipoprotein with Yx(FWY)xxD motif
MTRSKTITVLAISTAALTALIATGCGGGGGNNYANATSVSAGANDGAQASSASGTVGVGSTKLGRILVDSQGRSLYLFQKDVGTASTCYGACASAWPPLRVSGSAKAGAGVVAAKLGTAKRKDGEAEVTYNGHPLCYYAPDTAPGQVTGQGLNQFGAEWDAVAPSGKKIEGDE